MAERIDYGRALSLTLRARVIDSAHRMLGCATGHLMKHFIGVAVLVALALAVRFWVFRPLALDIHIHDTYYVMPPLRIIGFWLLMGIAAEWFVIAWKSGRV
jgi:hypothetical protein